MEAFVKQKFKFVEGFMTVGEWIEFLVWNYKTFLFAEPAFPTEETLYNPSQKALPIQIVY